jgi:hypothetical protein
MPVPVVGLVSPLKKILKHHHATGNWSYPRGIIWSPDTSGDILGCFIIIHTYCVRAYVKRRPL